MLRTNIDSRFSGIVKNMLNKGYTIFTKTMSGTQGEIAKLDLLSPDGCVYRVMMLDESVKYITFTKTYYLQTIQIIVGHTAAPINSLDIIWNSSLERDKEEVYYLIEGDYYTQNVEEAISVNKKRAERTSYKNDKMDVFLTPKTLEIVLNRLHSMPKKKSIKKKDVRRFYKTYNPYYSKYCYYADVYTSSGYKTIKLW